MISFYWMLYFHLPDILQLLVFYQVCQQCRYIQMIHHPQLLMKFHYYLLRVWTEYLLDCMFYQHLLRIQHHNPLHQQWLWMLNHRLVLFVCLPYLMELDILCVHCSLQGVLLQYYHHYQQYILKLHELSYHCFQDLLH